VTTITPNCWSESDQKAIREQLVRILNSGPFHQAQRRQRFLEYIVNEALAGRGERLKGYTVAQAVFDRAETFDSNIDPIVRNEAARVRDRLREYYDGDGQGDPVRIELPKGTYTPLIEFRQAPTRDPRPDRAAPVKQLGMLAGAVLLIITASVWGLSSWNSAPSLPDKSSVAVLPFDNIGTDPKWDRLADGMTQDIITDLSHSKDLVVIARNSTEPYKGKPIDIREIGRDLNVKYVLQGSIQSLGERLRVTARLIESASGSHIWSERYDRPVDDLFVVQNDVTQRIAATLTGYAGGLLRKPSAVFSSASRPRAYLPSTPTCWALRLKTR
jgi:adenylate cyclase